MNKVGFFRSIQLKFIIIYILLLIIAVQVIGSFFTDRLNDELTRNFKTSASERVEMLSHNLEQAFARDRSEESGTIESLEEEITRIINDINRGNASTTINVVDNQSRVRGTNVLDDQNQIGQKLNNSMVRDALLFNSTDDGTFYDDETDSRVYVYVKPILGDDDMAVGAVFYKSSLEEVYGQIEDINNIFLQGSILAITISAIIGILVARTITKPIMEMREQAIIMANGDFTQKVNVYGRDEIGQLAETFNDLNSRLKHSYATIEEERRKLSSILANMSDGVIATDNDGSVTLMNDAAAKLIGENPEDLIGDSVIDVLHLEGNEIDLSELHNNGSMIIDFSNEDTPFLIRANFTTVVDEEEEITGFITVISDVTEQQKMEQERRDFVSNVSHELRTPLTTMKSYLEALSDGAWENKEIAPRFLDVTQTETNRMIRMVNDLLQLSKMDSDELPMHKQREEFTSYLYQVLDRYEMNIPESIHMEKIIPNTKAYVWMDRDKITQVMDNVITNAIKYSPDGGKIRVKLDIRRHYLLISVQDQGMGIAYDKLDKIFERFYRVDKARNRKLGGTGLGLAITKELVEAHHGQIWAQSSEGKGTTILFTLPLMSSKRGDVR
ncbi:MULTISPECIES: cell wall metabolism sensor histidine kinase WalK [Oceanobacillus]|uniref:histidine kinase n=1 Tax=Oceanobacillus kimchii TaxID=746691 RepID=A0ABQ5TSZ2_9BACI|nr:MULTISPECIES: cell wall metabolism sensor histidine kinase WalK [Oceanobacillus]MBT2599941.1 cell wall metabolism sensor histidine kinase WalK [Oceanobacillus sp. ISL-74]MBT2652609.1 cell wall metabolism sensor histidine kinase WalK [Oceanobacillus sp. ISL-73]OEH56489.1 PAS domain-containing sensor histidine kinase [Oceanobacillus sp. E9]GLO68187.1 PAS domain-containing sensor histidine kinase [Oceanobacillus kimchii]